MAEKTRPEDTLESLLDNLWEVAQEQFATGEVDSPILHFLTDTSMGVLPLLPLPGLEPAHMARLIVGLYDPAMAAVLAEGWATNLALPADLNQALAGTRPWSDVSERVNKRLAPVLGRNPALAEAVRRGDVQSLSRKLRHDLTYAWHDATMGPVVRGEKSLKDLPSGMRRKILTLFGEDRQGNSLNRLWHIEQRAGRRHFVEESLEGAEQFTSGWRPLYLSWEMAARAGVPPALMRLRVRDLCREELRPYKVVETILFSDKGIFFGSPMPPYMQ